jgi:hypothetical protein
MRYPGSIPSFEAKNPGPEALRVFVSRLSGPVVEFHLIYLVCRAKYCSRGLSYDVLVSY